MDLQSKVASFYMMGKGRPPLYREAREYLEEEFDELLEALDEWALAVEEGRDGDARRAILHVAKESGDLSFTHAGLCEAIGIEYEEAADLVADSNMTKQPTPNGKIAKGPSYREPEMSSAII